MIDEQAGQSTPAPNPRVFLGWTVPEHVNFEPVDSGVQEFACGRDKRWIEIYGESERARESLGVWLQRHSHGASLSLSGGNITPVGSEGQDDSSTAQGASEGWELSDPKVELTKAIAETAAIPQWRAALAATFLLDEEGWRSPLPAHDPKKPLNTDPGAVTRLTVNIGPRTAEALNAVIAERSVTLTEALRVLVATGYAAAQRSSPLPDSETEWRCVRCGADRWVGWRAGPEHEGFPRRAQCVPCGHVQDLGVTS
ncbi:hypothetical protein ACIOD2_32235 [Amycolatopsis sp. NPDC088138]|uniref:hypothetical protein n=1 Tax=Amycolatopsis sp. NPDC088138 TaxID=3363938 RepID=UPI00380582AC